MRSKSYTEINSLSPTFVEQVAREFGPPDNFVESAEATFTDLPSVDSDPEAKGVVDRLEDIRDDLLKHHATSPNGVDGAPATVAESVDEDDAPLGSA